MSGTIFVLYYSDDADLDEVRNQLAELAAIPGVDLVPMVPADMNDATADE